ncbi:DUF222 domain-containing protein [Georgenia sp. AZ-5]|uniref:HNH endonuclease signature motif containing protein n=1 Tax=Georgenia sp. AZ-5 TaxID=3367526 RepID=UPI0037548332
MVEEDVAGLPPGGEDGAVGAVSVLERALSRTPAAAAAIDLAYDFPWRTAAGPAAALAARDRQGPESAPPWTGALPSQDRAADGAAVAAVEAGAREDGAFSQRARANDAHVASGADAPGLADGAGRVVVEYAPRLVSRYGISSARAVALEHRAPGWPLARALAGLALADADDATVVEAIAGWERLASWAASQQARAVLELTDRRGPSTAGAASAAAEIAARLGITHHGAEAKLGFASALDLYPEVADALTAGRIDKRKAEVLAATEAGLSVPEQRRVLADLLTPTSDATTHASTAAGGTPDGAEGAANGEAGTGAESGAGGLGPVVEVVEDLTGPQLRARLRRAALTTGGPAAGAKRRAKAFADRHVSITPAGDAMAWVVALVRADHAEATRVLLDALAAAAKGPADPRTLDQRRADALTDLVTTTLARGVDLTGAELPTFHGTKPHIQVTIAATTLLGLDEGVAELGGYGPIPADLARAIAADATWRGLFTDAAGHFAAPGTKGYRPGANLTRQVIARDVVCTFPGCRQPAWKADLDHISAYDPALAERLAQTTTTRLQALCRRHHNLKTTKYWTAVRDPRGHIRWTAPTGHTYTSPPPTPPGAPPPPTPPDRDPPADTPPDRDPPDDPPPF